jgi:hypothetical protein
MRKLPLVTARAAVEIRGVYGQSVLDLYGQMRRLLVQHTGNRTVGDVFAEPQLNPVRGEIAWYTGADGPIVPVAQLPPDAQQALWSQLDQLRAQIKSAAERYISSGAQTAGTRADTFRAMLTVTDPARCLFSVGGHPVLAEWGCSLVTGEERSVDLWTIGLARAQNEPVEPTNDAPPTIVATEPAVPAAVPDPALEPQPLTASEPLSAPQVDPIERTEPKPSKVFEAAPRKPTVRLTPPVSSVVPPVRRPTAADGAYKVSGSQDVRWHGHWDGGLWGLLRYLLLLILTLLLIGFLVRACSTVPDSIALSGDNEEQQLRTEIAALRDQAGQIAARCASTENKQ